MRKPKVTEVEIDAYLAKAASDERVLAREAIIANKLAITARVAMEKKQVEIAVMEHKHKAESAALHARLAEEGIAEYWDFTAERMGEYNNLEAINNSSFNYRLIEDLDTNYFLIDGVGTDYERKIRITAFSHFMANEGEEISLNGGRFRLIVSAPTGAMMKQKLMFLGDSSITDIYA